MTASKARRDRQVARSARSSQRLVTAAIELIAEQGYERTTLAAIGDRAGYSREMVRVRYGSKEGLLETLMRTEYEAMLLRPVSADASGLEQVLERIAHVAHQARENREFLRAFFVLCFETVGPVPQLSPWMRRWLGIYQERIEAAYRIGQADGSIRPDLVAEAEAHRFVSYGLGLGFRWLLEENNEFDRALSDWVNEIRHRAERGKS